MKDTSEAAQNTTDQRLAHWECLLIKFFAILFLFLFLSEKAIKEVGSIRRTWVAEITIPGSPVESVSGCVALTGNESGHRTSRTTR